MMPRFKDGSINLRELIRRLAEDVANALMAAEAEQLCGDTGNSRNGYQERGLETCAGTLTLKIPKLRSGSFFPEDIIERYQHVDRALASCVAEMYATGTSTRKVAKVAEKMGVARLSKDQVSAQARSLPTRGAGHEAATGKGGALRLARRHLREAQAGPQRDVDRRSHRHRLRRVRLAARARRLHRRHRVARLVTGLFDPGSLLPLAR